MGSCHVGLFICLLTSDVWLHSVLSGESAELTLPRPVNTITIIRFLSSFEISLFNLPLSGTFHHFHFHNLFFAREKPCLWYHFDFFHQVSRCDSFRNVYRSSTSCIGKAAATTVLVVTSPSTLPCKPQQSPPSRTPKVPSSLKQTWPTPSLTFARLAFASPCRRARHQLTRQTPQPAPPAVLSLHATVRHSRSDASPSTYLPLNNCLTRHPSHPNERLPTVFLPPHTITLIQSTG